MDTSLLIILLVILNVILIFIVIGNNVRLSRLEKKYKMFMKGTDAQSLEKSFARKFTQIDRLFEKVAGRIMHQESVNTILLMDYIGQDSIAQVSLQEVPEELAGKTLAESGLKTKYNILVMLVERGGLKAEAANAHTVFQPGDKLTVFGQYKVISTAFKAKERFL